MALLSEGFRTCATDDLYHTVRRHSLCFFTPKEARRPRNGRVCRDPRELKMQAGTRVVSSFHALEAFYAALTDLMPVLGDEETEPGRLFVEGAEGGDRKLLTIRLVFLRHHSGSSDFLVSLRPIHCWSTEYWVYPCLGCPSFWDIMIPSRSMPAAGKVHTCLLGKPFV